LFACYYGIFPICYLYRLTSEQVLLHHLASWNSNSAYFLEQMKPFFNLSFLEHFCLRGRIKKTCEKIFIVYGPKGVSGSSGNLGCHVISSISFPDWTASDSRDNLQPSCSHNFCSQPNVSHPYPRNLVTQCKAQTVRERTLTTNGAIP
jgi:hypothetical protein